MGKWKAGHTVAVILAALVFVGFFVWLITDNKQQPASTVQVVTDNNEGNTNTNPTLEIKDKSQSITVGLDSYTYPPDSSAVTEVYPTYWVQKADGAYRVDGASANSTSSVIDEVLNVYGGGASYYVDPVLNYDVTGQNAIIKLKAYPIVADTNLNIVAYDSTGSTALTADDGVNNTADYSNGDRGADENYINYVTFKDNVADKRFNLCAIATGYNNDVDDFTPVDVTYNGASVQFSEVAVPKQLKDLAVTQYNDANTSYPAKFMHVFKLNTPINMKEWDEVKVKLLTEEGSNAPTANTGDLTFGQFIDCAWYKGDDDVMYNDFYTHDKTQSITSVGMAEATTSIQGLTSGFVIEQQ